MTEMPTYFERYCNGECEAVYRELIALGGAVRQEPLFSDAKAVARETVRRSCHNLMLLHERLLKLGFEFAEPDKALRMADTNALLKLKEFERTMGMLPILVQTWFLTFESVYFWQPKHQVRCFKDSPPQKSDVWGLASHPVLIFQTLDECLNMWQEMLVGYAEDRKHHPEWPEAPLRKFMPLGAYASNCEEKGFAVPCDGIDAVYFNDGDGDKFFNDELRHAFEWGGFPFWKAMLNSPEFRAPYEYKPDFPRLLPILKDGLLKV